MRKILVDFARKDGLLNSLYRACLHIKLFVLSLLGFRTATWYSKDGKIIDCNIVSDEVRKFFTGGKK